jgi:hypothetical protein
MMPILTSSGVIRPGTVRAEQQGLLAAGGFLAQHLVAHHQHVAHRNAFGNADDQIKVGFDRFPDRGRGTRWRYVDHRDGGTSLGSGLLDRAIDRNAENALAGFLGIDPGDEAVLAVGVFLAFSVWNCPVLPVMPWVMILVSLLIRIDMVAP